MKTLQLCNEFFCFFSFSYVRVRQLDFEERAFLIKMSFFLYSWKLISWVLKEGFWYSFGLSYQNKYLIIVYCVLTVLHSINTVMLNRTIACFTTIFSQIFLVKLVITEHHTYAKLRKKKKTTYLFEASVHHSDFWLGEFCIVQ